MKSYSALEIDLEDDKYSLKRTVQVDGHNHVNILGKDMFDNDDRSGVLLLWEIPHKSDGGIKMSAALKEYDAKMDAKKRITLRNALFEYYHVAEFDDGRIVLEPRELVAPFQISEKSLAMMDSSVDNLKQGNVSPAVDLTAFEA